jgi:hypothetical protein
VQCDIHWNPTGWDEVPSHALALEPILDAVPLPQGDGCVSKHQAAVYIEAHNRKMIGTNQPRWVVAFPVEIRYEGEPAQGDDFVLPTPQSLVMQT